MDTRALVAGGLLLLAVALVAAPATGVLVLGDGSSYETKTGLNVTVNGSVTINTVDFVNQDSVAFRPRLRARSPGTSSAELLNLSGPYNELTQIDGSANRVRLGAPSGTRATVRSDVDALSFRRTSPFYGVGDGVIDFSYTATTTADIAVRPVPANNQLCAVDEVTDNELDCATSSGTGTVRFASLATGDHDVLLQAGQAPMLNDSSADPQPPDEYVDDRQATLSIDVDDREFPTDTVTVTFFRDGTQVGQDTLTDAGTASVSGVFIPPGENTWWAVAEDDDGLTDRSANFTVTSPGILSVKDRQTDALITGQNVTVDFYTPVGIDTRVTTDGTIDMINLPNRNMRVDVFGETYPERQYQFSAIDTNLTVYLIPEAEANNLTDITFILDDQTGDFPPENTTLFVQETFAGQWTTIGSGLFGSLNEVTIALDPDVNYRLVVENNQGARKVADTYSPPETPETKTITISESADTPAGGTGYKFKAEYRVGQGGDNDSIFFSFADPSNSTTDLDVRIYERGNQTNNTIFADNFTGPLGKLTIEQNLTDEQENTVWVVNATADRDGRTLTFQKILQKGQNPFDLPLDAKWLTAIGVIILLLSGFIFGGIDATIGGIMLPLEGLFLWYLGVLPAVVGLPTIIAALFIGIVVHARSRGGAVQ